MPFLAGIYYTLFEERQAGPLLVLIHGAGGNHLSWPHDFRRLKGWRVLALDLPGHGKSEGIGQHSLSGYAGRLMEFIEALQTGPVILLGHSLGGGIALQIALQKPELLLGMGLISSGAHFAIAAEFAECFRSTTSFSAGLQLFRQRAFGARASEQMIEQTMRSLSMVRPGILFSDWQACATFDIRDRMQQIQIPAWIATGGQDKLTPPAYAHYLAANLPQAQLQIIPEGGHMVMLEQPEEVLRGLNAFLSSLAR